MLDVFIAVQNVNVMSVGWGDYTALVSGQEEASSQLPEYGES